MFAKYIQLMVGMKTNEIGKYVRIIAKYILVYLLAFQQRCQRMLNIMRNICLEQCESHQQTIEELETYFDEPRYVPSSSNLIQ